MSPNRIFMFLINPSSGNVRIQKLIAKHNNNNIIIIIIIIIIIVIII